LRQRVDGLILSPLQGRGTDLSYLSAWIQDRLPLVFLEKVPNIPANVVDIRNAKAAAEAVGYLIGLGHTRIAYLGGPDYSLHNLERIAGFQKAMMEHGLPVRPRFVRKAGVYIDDGHRAAHELFNGTGETPTAVFCFNDLIAIGALNALAERNLRVPEDVSVIGFDDIEFCGSVRVPLTSVSVPAFEMGRAAAGLLIRQIEYREQALNEVVELEAKLVLRASCSAPRQSPISKTGAL
jgi:DNA-binding LacI/PurR family transcriptional regulator